MRQCKFCSMELEKGSQLPQVLLVRVQPAEPNEMGLAYGTRRALAMPRLGIVTP